jgi:hypothetical protein
LNTPYELKVLDVIVPIITTNNTEASAHKTAPNSAKVISIFAHKFEQPETFQEVQLKRIARVLDERDRTQIFYWTLLQFYSEVVQCTLASCVRVHGTHQ